MLEKNQNTNLVIISNNKPKTTSLKIAEYFGKLHKDVLEKIKNLETSQEFTERNFTLSSYTDISGKSNPMYEITENGFTFLTMGFTGKKASKFKEDYILAFEKMKEFLQNQSQTQPKELSRLEILKIAMASEEENIKLQKENQTQKLELDHKNSIILFKISEVPPKTMRAKINEICRNTKNRDFQARWTLLYKEFYYTYNINLKERSENSKIKSVKTIVENGVKIKQTTHNLSYKSPIDIAEEIGELEHLYLLSLKLFETNPILLKF